MQYHRAQDTFIADLEDGSSVRVAKGDVLPESHELVRRDADGAGVLFRPLDEVQDGDSKPPRGRGRSRAAAGDKGDSGEQDKAK